MFLRTFATIPGGTRTSAVDVKIQLVSRSIHEGPLPYHRGVFQRKGVMGDENA